MRRFAWLFGLLASLTTLATAGSSYPPAVSKTLYADHDFRGKKAPELSAAKWLTPLPDTKGKILVVDFWATWCPPCRETIPELGEWQKKFAKDIVVIGISGETEETVSKFMKTTSMPYTVGIDAKQKMSGTVGVKGIPHVLVITPDGVVRWQGFPLDEKDTLNDTILQQIIDTWHASSQS